MPTIIFIAFDGSRREIPVTSGVTVMEGAIHNGVAGIVAECGGAMACGTCQVLVDDKWRERVGPPGDNEHNMLEFIERLQPGSRLACQIHVSESLDGLILHTPEEQHRS